MINPSICEHVDSEIVRYPDGSGKLYCKTCGVEMLHITPSEFKRDWETLHTIQQRRQYPEHYVSLVRPRRPLRELLARLKSLF